MVIRLARGPVPWLALIGEAGGRVVWQFGYIPDPIVAPLSPLPPLCIVLSQWQRILQPAALEKEERESDVALRPGTDRRYGFCCRRRGDAFGPEQQYGSGFRKECHTPI